VVQLAHAFGLPAPLQRCYASGLAQPAKPSLVTVTTLKWRRRSWQPLATDWLGVNVTPAPFPPANACNARCKVGIPIAALRAYTQNRLVDEAEATTPTAAWLNNATNALATKSIKHNNDASISWRAKWASDQAHAGSHEAAPIATETARPRLCSAWLGRTSCNNLLHSQSNLYQPREELRAHRDKCLAARAAQLNQLLANANENRVRWLSEV